MKFVILNLQSSKEKWAQEAVNLYTEKISHFIPLEIKNLKSTDFSREQKQNRLIKEAEVLNKELKTDDLIIVLDEKGKQEDSISFSKSINKILLSGKKRAVFIVGGPFGTHESIKSKSHQQVSLSPLTFNHLLAEVILLEQIYRAFSILKNLPYHNN